MMQRGELRKSHEVSDIRKWATVYHRLVEDRSGRMTRWLAQRTVVSPELVDDEWFRTYEKLAFDLNQLDSRGTRILNSGVLPRRLKASLQRALEALQGLHNAVRDGFHSTIDPHELRHEHLADIDANAETERVTGAGSPAQCPAPDCNEQFDSASALRRHFRSQHRVYPEDLLLESVHHRNAVENARIECISVLPKLTWELESDEPKELVCEKCHAVAKTQALLDKHRSTGCSPKSTYECPQCYGRFVPSRSDQKFCGDSCRKKASRERRSAD